MFNLYMARAIELAKCAAAIGEIPVGAVVVNKMTKRIIGEGYNLREKENDSTFHAEIIAIKNACANLKSWRLSNCDIYVTLEPCPMCAGAIINSRIDSVYFGAFDKNSGSVCSVQHMFSFPYNYTPQYYAGIMEKDCSELLHDFFSKIR